MLARPVLALALVLTGAGLPAASGAAVSGELPTASVSAATVPVDGVVGQDDGEVSVDEVELVVPPTTADGTVTDVPAVAAAPEEALVAEEPVGAGRVATEVLETEGFQTVGVTWPGDATVGELGLEVRARAQDGTWSAWTPLPQADDAPDAGTADAAQAVRGGTDPVWVGDAVAVQVSVPAGAQAGPADMTLALVDVPEVVAPSAATAASTGGAAVVSAGLVLPTAVTSAAPRIITRAEWGARPQVCEMSVASGLVGAVVHHTAGKNTYASVAEAMQQIRGDQAYHIDGRGWCDLGYNFIVDKWGNVYEGRAGSMTQPVIGVHAGGFNTATVGISMLGDYSTVSPPAATQEAIARVLAWRLGAYDVKPAGSVAYRTLGGENSRFAAGTTVTLPVIFGHRDTAFTACPGNAGYATLGGIRARTSALALSAPIVSALYHDMLQRSVDPTGLASWTAALNNGTSVSVLADTLARSQEYVVRRVVDAYQEVLHRGPDATGLASWSAAISSGRLRAEDLRGALISSDEYYARAGGTDAAYVTALYRDILRREPSAGEVASWTAQIATVGRGAAPHGVWRSLESAHLRIHELYRTYLDRPADVTGIATWGPYWQANGEDALRMQVVGSQEYVARALAAY